MGRTQRYYTVNWDEEYQLNTDTFADADQAAAYREFASILHNNGYYGSSLARRLRAIRKGLANARLKDVTWEWIMMQVQNADRKDCLVWLYYLLYLVEHNLYHADYEDVLIARFDELKRIFSLGTFTPSIREYASQITPYSIISRESVSSKKNVIIRNVAIPGADKALYDLLNRYLDWIEASYNGTLIGSYTFTMLRVAFDDYDKSLGAVLNYNDAIFEYQYDKVCRYHPPFTKDEHRIRAALLGQLTGFYLFLQAEMTDDERAERFRIYDSNVLKYPLLQMCLERQYTVVRYNIYSEPPISDKLLINAHDMSIRGAGTVDKPVMIDFSQIRNDVLRKWVKECFWYDASHVLGSRPKVYNPLFVFLNIVSERIGDAGDISFTLDDVLTYKRSLISEQSGSREANIARKLSIVRFFFKYIEAKKYVAIDAVLYRMLVHCDDPDNQHKDAYTPDEIHKLSAAYRNYADEHTNTHFGILYDLYYYIFLVLSVSDIRLTNLLETRTDSLVPVLSNKGSTEYVLVIRAKNSADEDQVYNITKYVKELIVEVAKLTEDIRAEAIGSERDYLFVYRRKSHNSVALVRSGAFADYHKKICDIAGVRALSFGAVRKMYEQKSGDRLVKDGYERSMTKAITGHSLDTQVMYYDKPDMIEFCQRFFQVEIGSIQIAGKIETEHNTDRSHTVMNGCGHCDLNHCVLHGNLECLLCTHFVATISNIPFFEQMVRDLDVAIEAEPLLHEREFMYHKKRLCVAYLMELYELRGKVNTKDEE